MVTKIIEWVSITALLLVVSWRPYANYQILLQLLVCAGAVLLVLALFSIKHRVETHYTVEVNAPPTKNALRTAPYRDDRFQRSNLNANIQLPLPVAAKQ